MTTALATVDQLQVMANSIAKSGLFGIKTPEQAMALMLIAQSEGLHPATAARDYNIIQGKPAKTAEAMLRSFIADGGKVEWHTLDDTKADATFSHPSGGTVRISWDFARAKAAGLGSKDMWLKYPRQMLRSRTVSEGVRTVCPAATSGMYVPEEVRDFTPKEKVVNETPAPVEPKPVTPTVYKRILGEFAEKGIDEQKLRAHLGKEPSASTKEELSDAYAKLCTEEV